MDKFKIDVNKTVNESQRVGFQGRSPPDGMYFEGLAYWKGKLSNVGPGDLELHCRVGSPNGWVNWNPPPMVDAEIRKAIIAQMAAVQPTQHEPPSPMRNPPWSYGATDRPGSPHLDPNDSEYWSREAVQERADGKALLREGRERYGDDWYPGKYTN